jgi:hypothetical protein
VWRAHDEIEWKRRLASELNLDCLVELIAGTHDDKNVDVAIGVRCAIGMGSEQDDLVGMKAFDNTSREGTNDSHGHVGTTVPAGWLSLR